MRLRPGIQAEPAGPLRVGSGLARAVRQGAPPRLTPRAALSYGKPTQGDWMFFRFVDLALPVAGEGRNR